MPQTGNTLQITKNIIRYDTILAVTDAIVFGLLENLLCFTTILVTNFFAILDTTIPIETSNYMENEDELEIRIKSSSKEALEDAQNLRLEEIYNRHKDIVQEIIKKMKYYNSEYIECLFKDTGALFQSKDELYRLLYGGYANPDEFGKRPLSKFIKDIYQNTKEVLDGFDIFSDIDT